MTEKNQIIAMTADVEIKAAEAAEGEEAKGPPSFSVVAYTGGPMHINGFDHPIAVDLNGLGFGKSLVANLDHDSTKRVGNVTAKSIENNQLVLSGLASAATPYRDEVVASAASGFVWQASIEARPDQLVELAFHALDEGDATVAATRALYRGRRDRLCDGLAAIGWRVRRPRASMYVWTRIPEHYGGDDRRFVEELFQRCHVLLSPGSGFGASGRGYVRFSLVVDEPTCDEVARRIAASGVLDASANSR